LTVAHPTPDIGARLDRLPLTRLHVFTVGVCIFAMACGLGEISLSGALSAIVSTGPNKASSAELSALLSSVYVGAIVGAPLFGYLADRLGRRTILIAVLLWTALMSIAAGFTQDVLQLAVCRGLAGLALGALPPLVVALLADVMPPGRRGAMTLWCVALATLGPTCTLLFLRVMATSPVSGVDAWRLTFWVLAGACALTAAAAIGLPESPRFLSVRGRSLLAGQALARYEGSPPLRWLADGSKADRPPPEAGASGQRKTGLVFVLFALSPWATAAFAVLWGAVLTERGFALNDALLVVGLSTLGPLVGNLLGSMGVDRVDRRHGLALGSAMMLVTGALFVTADVAAWALFAAAFYGMAASIYLSILNLYAAEYFPTEGRGRRLASAWALNRVGAAIAPLLLVPLLRSHGAPRMFIVVGGVIVLSIVVTYLAPKGLQRHGLS
jgi:putative MFS transporter